MPGPQLCDAPIPKAASPMAWGAIKRLVLVDQNPLDVRHARICYIHRLFDHVRRIFAEDESRSARITPPAGSPSTSPRPVLKPAKEKVCWRGTVFMPSVYAPCSTCDGARYNAKTLEYSIVGKNIGGGAGDDRR